MLTSPLRNDLHELLPFLTPQEHAEIEMLAMAPPDAEGCMALHFEGVTDAREKALAEYVAKNGYFPAMVIDINFVAPDPARFID